MRRIATGSNRNPAIDLFGTGKHGFKTGNRSLGDPPSTPGGEWYNAVQETLAQAIEQGMGVALDPNDHLQLLKLIKHIAWAGNSAAPYQVQDETLTALAGLTTSADKLIYATGADAFAMTALTPFARTLLDDADAVTARSTLGAAPLVSPVLTGTPTAPTASTGTRSTQLATTAFVGAESQIAAPTGSVYTFAGSTVPTGWLKCNGALLSRTTYASLFAVIGTTYGAGDGSTTFALPDLRGEFVRGADDGRGVDAGRVLGSAQAGQNASHTHTANTSPAGGHSHSFENLARIADADRGIGNASLWSINDPVTQTTSAVGDHIHAVTVNADGGNESRPRNVAMHYIIKY